MDGNEQIFHEGDLLEISNRYVIKIRTDKIVSEVLNVTKSRMKEMVKSGIIDVIEIKQEHKIIIEIQGDIYNEGTF